MAKKLTEKQQSFVNEYLIDLNATQAAIRAGYSVNNADKIGSELLGKTRVAEEIGKALAERSKRTGINADRIVHELAKIAFFNPANVVNFDTSTVKKDASMDDLACIQSVKVKKIPTEEGDIIEREIKFYDKNRALEQLGKHLGMFTDKFKVDMESVIIMNDLEE